MPWLRSERCVVVSWCCWAATGSSPLLGSTRARWSVTGLMWWSFGKRGHLPAAEPGDRSAVRCPAAASRNHQDPVMAPGPTLSRAGVGNAVDVSRLRCSNGGMDAGDLAEQFALGRAVKLSDGPVARGKQGLVWRLDTTRAAGRSRSPSDSRPRTMCVRRRPSTRRRTPPVCRRPRCAARRREPCSPASTGAKHGCMSGSTCAPPTPVWILPGSAPWLPAYIACMSPTPTLASLTLGTESPWAPTAGMRWSSGSRRLGRPLLADCPTCAMSWSRWSLGSSRRKVW